MFMGVAARDLESQPSIFDKDNPENATPVGENWALQFLLICRLVDREIAREGSGFF
jgi:hypothetical protein